MYDMMEHGEREQGMDELFDSIANECMDSNTHPCPSGSSCFCALSSCSCVHSIESMVSESSQGTGFSDPMEI